MGVFDGREKKIRKKFCEMEWGGGVGAESCFLRNGMGIENNTIVCCIDINVLVYFFKHFLYHKNRKKGRRSLCK